MKSVFSIDKEIGGDGGHVTGAVGIEGANIAVDVKATFPLSKVIDPVMVVVDGLIDKVEAWIPGDQKAAAAVLKAEARAELISLLSEPAAPPAP